MTKLKAANVFFFQWFFIRLTKHIDKRVTDYVLQSIDLMQNGSYASRGTGKIKAFQWYSIQYWILPLTGWWSDFVYLNKSPKFIKLTKEKMHEEN